MVLLFSLTACGALGDVSDLGNDFKSALSTGDNATSYKMLHPDIQTEMGGEAGWADWTSIRNFEKWSLISNSVENTTAELQGSSELDGETHEVYLYFDQVDDAWLITGISFE